MTAEHQYLCDLVRTWAAGRETTVPLPPGVGAEAVVALLHAHKVEAALGPLLPPAVANEAFARQMDLGRNRTDFLLLELERLCPVFAAVDVHPVVLKGAALALGTYVRPADRWFLDLDLLVPRPAVTEVCARLETAGYLPMQGRRDPLFYEKHHLHRIMLGPPGSVVEIHWALTLPGSVYRHDVAGVEARAEPFALGRHQVQCAAPVDLILHGVYQNIADGFVDLRRVLDLVQLVRRLDAAKWAELVALSHLGGTQRALWTSLHMMKQMTDVAAPPEVASALQPDWATRRTLEGLQLPTACLDREAERAEGYAQMLHLLLTPTWPQRLREALRSLWVGEAMLLDQGHDPNHLPGFIKRSKLGLGQFKYLLMAKLSLFRAFVTGSR